MKRLTAQRPILYGGRMYQAGDTLPAYDKRMVQAWLSAESAKMTDDAAEEATMPPQDADGGQDGTENADATQDTQEAADAAEGAQESQENHNGNHSGDNTDMVGGPLGSRTAGGNEQGRPEKAGQGHGRGSSARRCQGADRGAPGGGYRPDPCGGHCAACCG